jgi:hypothetical protein
MTPLHMPPIGSVAGYTLTATRRPALPRDRVNGASVVVVEMSNGSETHEVAAVEDHAGAPREARDIGLAIIAAFAAIGTKAAA